MDIIFQNWSILIISCVISFAVMTIIRFASGSLKKTKNIRKEESYKPSDVFRPSIPSSFGTPYKENIMKLPTSSRTLKMKSPRSSRLSSPSCYGYDSGDSDSDQDSVDPTSLNNYFEEEKSDSCHVAQSRTPSFAKTPSEFSRSPYTPTDAVRYVPAPLSCAFNITETPSRRNISKSLTSYGSGDSSIRHYSSSDRLDSPHSNRYRSGQSPETLLPIELPFSNQSGTKLKGKMTTWPEDKMLDALTSKLLQKVLAC